MEVNGKKPEMPPPIDREKLAEDVIRDLECARALINLVLSDQEILSAVQHKVAETMEAERQRVVDNIMLDQKKVADDTAP